MDLGLLRGLIALVTLSTFLGICWWAYRPANRLRFEEDGLLAFDPEEIDEGSVACERARNEREGREGEGA